MRGTATHEDFSREHAVRGPSDRSFGVVMAVFFAVVALWPAVHHRPVRMWALAAAAALLLAAIAAPAALYAANRAWMKVGLAVGRVTNPIVTALMFFVVFTPAALVARMLGRDPLRLRYDREAESYWIPRQPPGPAPESMRNQF
jgi:hypothetical protein